MTGTSTKKRKKRKKKNSKIVKKSLLFIKVFLITYVLCSVTIIAAGGIILSTVKAPDIPSVSNIPNNGLKPDTADTDKKLNFRDIAYFSSDGEKGEQDADLAAPEGFADQDRKELFYTFLIIGLDGGVNTDTIMVASYDALNKKANIISIPRDSLVNADRPMKKINAAYASGTLNGGGVDGGIEQLKREVKTITGIVPDFYVCIDLDAFVKIVDAVGGIDIEIPFNMKYDDPVQDLHIDLKEGLQHLEGQNALRFARYRKGNNGRGAITDYQRIENQQGVIKEVLKNLLKPANILKIPEFIKIFNEYVHTDVKPENILWFASQLKEINGTEALSTYTMPTTGTSGLPMYYEYLDKFSIVDLVNRTINPYEKDIEAKDLDIIGEYELQRAG